MISSGRCHGPHCAQPSGQPSADGLGGVTFEQACRDAEAARPVLAAAGWPVPSSGAAFPLVASDSPQEER